MDRVATLEKLSDEDLALLVLEVHDEVIKRDMHQYMNHSAEDLGYDMFNAAKRLAEVNEEAAADFQHQRVERRNPRGVSA